MPAPSAGSVCASAGRVFGPPGTESAVSEVPTVHPAGHSSLNPGGRARHRFDDEASSTASRQRRGDRLDCRGRASLETVVQEHKGRVHSPPCRQGDRPHAFPLALVRLLSMGPLKRLRGKPVIADFASMLIQGIRNAGIILKCGSIPKAPGSSRTRAVRNPHRLTWHGRRRLEAGGGCRCHVLTPTSATEAGTAGLITPP
jgi:hypothetical protein